MTRGYPDFFGQAIFPGYGVLLNEDTGDIVFADGLWHTIISLSCKGKLCEALLDITTDASLVLQNVRLTLDGTVVYTRTITDSSAQNAHPNNEIMFPVYFDPDEFHIIFGFRDEIIWNYQFLLEAQTVALVEETVNCRFNYYQVAA